MIRRAAVQAIVVVLLVGLSAWAEVDPVTLERIPKGKKYSHRQIAEFLAKQASSKREQERVEAVGKARAEYLKQLETLRVYYKEYGNAEGLRKTSVEIEDVRNARHFVYLYWEDKLPELSATSEDPNANRRLAEADRLRKRILPFQRKARMRKAAVLYREILEKYPRSTAVDSAAYGLGEVYVTSVFSEYRRAVRFFELCYLSNPRTQHDALFRAAQVCDSDLTDYENAARYYWMASRMSPSAYSRHYAAARLRQLKTDGFGTAYGVEKESRK